MKVIIPYREERTEAAIARAVADYLKTKTQATRDSWRFGCLVIYYGVNVDADQFATVPSPKPLAAEAARELGETLEDMAEIIDGLLNPPAVAAPRVFVLSAVAVGDSDLGLALTNAADDETFGACLDKLAASARRRITLQ